MMKPRTILWIAAAGVAAYGVWHWQKQRLVKFDQSLFSNNEETTRSLSPGFTIQKQDASENAKRRPISTTVYKGEPGKRTPPVKTAAYDPAAGEEAGEAPTAQGSDSAAPTNNHHEPAAPPAPAAPADARPAEQINEPLVTGDDDVDVESLSEDSDQESSDETIEPSVSKES